MRCSLLEPAFRSRLPVITLPLLLLSVSSPSGRSFPPPPPRPSTGASSPRTRASIPDTAQAMIAQAGGLGLRGAFVDVGAQHFTYRCAEPRGEYRSSRPSRLVPESGQGFIDSTQDSWLSGTPSQKNIDVGTVVLSARPPDQKSISTRVSNRLMLPSGYLSATWPKP